MTCWTWSGRSAGRSRCRATRPRACCSASARARAPLFALASRLAERGSQTDYLLGAESADRVFGALTARRTGRSAVITTADGSLGSRGSVVDMLPTVVQQARTDVIYASAPTAVLRSVCAMAGRYGIPVQALVSEPAMTCGTGLCMGCVLPAVGNDGITRMVRACVEGPVFRGDLVRWDDVGTIPFDALGAPGWKPRPAAGGAGPATAASAPGSAVARSAEERRSNAADLRTRIGHLDLPVPILTASGCAGTGRELAQFTDVARIGAVITKSVTLEPKAGNPSPRMAETPSGLLSSVGLQGPGLDGFLQRDLPWLLSRGARAFVSRRRAHPPRVRRDRLPAVGLGRGDRARGEPRLPGRRGGRAPVRARPRRGGRGGGRRARAAPVTTSRSSPSCRPRSPTSSRWPGRASRRARTGCR